MQTVLVLTRRGVLLTDVVGSTPLARDLGPRWAAVLGRHNEIVRAACRRHGGEVSASSGDGFSFVFVGADDATAAAWEITSDVETEPWPEDAPLRVRVGVHFGAVEQFAGEFVGVTFHEAARVTALAGTSNVVLTEVARNAIGSLPNGTTLVDLGPHVVRDFPTPVRLFRLQELGADRPHALDRNTHVAALRPILGRDDVLARIRDELAAERMVSIVGPGGIGKTTVAIEVMRRHPGDAVVANLTEVESDDEVGTAVADLFRAGRQTSEGLAEIVASKSALVVLDNCEHVLDGVREVCRVLLEACPRVQLLATSRQPIEITGERPVLIGPLRPADAAELLVRHASRSIGVDRAEQMDRASVQRVCERLDYIPLAIELAAARLRVLGLDDLQDRLTDQMAMLADPRRPGSDRQKTMAATISWSLGLLDDAERNLFRSLSVFMGGATLDAIVGLVSVAGELDVLDLLEELVRGSLVVQDDARGRTRYRMLEPIRQFADRLLTAGEREELADRHARWVDRLLRLTAPHQLSAEARATLSAESANISAGIDHSIDRGEINSALRMIGRLGYLWFTERPAEGWRLTQRALGACDGSEQPRLRASALLTVGTLLQQQLRLDESRAALDQALALLGDEPSTDHAWTRFYMGRTDAMAGRLPAAREMFDLALATFTAVGDPAGTGWTQLWRARLADDDLQADITDALLEFARTEGLSHLMAAGLANLAAPQAFKVDEIDRGFAELAEAVDLFRDLNDTWQVMESLLSIVSWSLHFDRPNVAEVLREAAPLLSEFGDEANQRRFIGLTAEALRRSNEVAKAADLAWAVGDSWRTGRFREFEEWIDRCRRGGRRPTKPLALEDGLTVALDALDAIGQPLGP